MLAAGWGRIVTISSSSAQSGAPNMAHYAASKGGVIGLTKALAVELARSGITVNTIPPSLVDTPMARHAEAAGDFPGVDVIGPMVPLGRAGTPDDIAAAAPSSAPRTAATSPARSSASTAACTSEPVGRTGTHSLLSVGGRRPAAAAGDDMTDTAPRVEITGPIPGTGTNRMPRVIGDQYGYVEEEFFLQGDAQAYRPVGELTGDGKWTVEPDGTAPFKTRVLVRRPADPDAFNGTVIVDWFNVTAGVDGDPDFGLLYPVLLSGGFAYVGVSAQQVAVGGGQSALDIPGVPNLARKPLTESDPERYGTLVHPGDAFSYDMYAQVAAAVRRGDLLGGTTPTHVLAVGESQSAFRLVAFINAIQPVTGAFDGFLVHSRGGSSAPVAGSEVQSRPEEGPPVTIRTDIDVPVLQFETETDLLLLGYLAARQPDTERIVTWEVAGAAHADASLLEYGRIANPEVEFDLGEFIPTMNRGPQREVLRAAFIALHEWVVSGTPPPVADRIETTDGGIRRDADGNAVGGIRTPAVDAPVAAHSGESAGDEIIFQLFGSTIPFTAEQLQARYPSHEAYVAAVTSSADAAVAARFLLPDDRDRIVEEARAAPVRDERA